MWVDTERAWLERQPAVPGECLAAVIRCKQAVRMQVREQILKREHKRDEKVKDKKNGTTNCLIKPFHNKWCETFPFPSNKVITVGLRLWCFKPNSLFTLYRTNLITRYQETNQFKSYRFGHPYLLIQKAYVKWRSRTNVWYHWYFLCVMLKTNTNKKTVLWPRLSQKMADS